MPFRGSLIRLIGRWHSVTYYRKYNTASHSLFLKYSLLHYLLQMSYVHVFLFLIILLPPRLFIITVFGKYKSLTKSNCRSLIYTFPKRFAPLTLISLNFKLSIPVKSRKMIWSSSICQRMFHEPITIGSLNIFTLSLCRGHSWWVRLAKQETLTPPWHMISPLVCRGLWMSIVVLHCWCHSDGASVLLYFTFKGPIILRDENICVQKPKFLTQKCKITIIMCPDNVFSIIVWDFIKNYSKLQKLQPFSSIYPNAELVHFKGCDFCKMCSVTHIASIPRLQ